MRIDNVGTVRIEDAGTVRIDNFGTVKIDDAGTVKNGQRRNGMNVETAQMINTDNEIDKRNIV